MTPRCILSVLCITVTLFGCSIAPRVADNCQCETPQKTAGKPVYQQVGWDTLPGWQDNQARPGFLAWRNGCSALKNQPAWAQICLAADAVPDDEASIRQFIETHFTPLQVSLSDRKNTGLVTGYYEPLLIGNRYKTTQARYPVYAPPADLITVDLGILYPDLKNRRLRGRIVGNKLVPYYDRADIEQGKVKLQTIAWVNDPIELFFLQIQGSGRIQLPDGSMMRVGYADQNGHPYRSIGTWLIEKGELSAAQASMQGIQAWARANPGKLNTLLNVNPSFVFFRELPNATGGPLGAMGIALTDGYSVAVDRNFIPLGAPVFLATQYPNSSKPLQRLVAAQDTGGAIRGPIRVDYFWGFGKAAGELAGKMKQQGSVWILWPKKQPMPF